MGADNPMMQAFMNNPDLMRTMMQSSPVIQNLMEQNPQMAEVLNNPEVLRDAMRAMSSPVRPFLNDGRCSVSTVKL